MPELPDVEHHRRTAEEHAVGRTVTGVRAPDPEILAGTSPQGAGRSLGGRELTAAHRHGKWLLLRTGGDGATDGPKLLVHFRMTGWLVVCDAGAEPHDDDAVVLELGDRELRYRTSRRLGRVHWLSAGADPETVTGPLGPDGLDVGRGELRELLAGRRGGIKSALMDQELVAGLGNELVDEILWRARIHPRRTVADLDADEHDALGSCMRRTLRQAVRAGHVPSGPTWLNAQRGGEDSRCPDCGAALRRDRVAGRATYTCPRHQPAPG